VEILDENCVHGARVEPPVPDSCDLLSFQRELVDDQ